MHVMVVEDDEETAAYIARALGEFGHLVQVARDGRDALFEATGTPFDVIVLDRMLPVLDGMSFLRRLRAEGIMTPVLMLSALGGLDDRVEGLEAGADDYLVKPFAAIELNARLNALARRPAVLDDPGILNVGDLELNLFQRQVRRAGRVILLQPREFAILAELMRNADRVVTRTMLLERVWDYHFDPKTNIVESHVSRLRTKLNEGFPDDAITTLRGAGYIVRSHA